MSDTSYIDTGGYRWPCDSRATNIRVSLFLRGNAPKGSRRDVTKITKRRGGTFYSTGFVVKSTPGAEILRPPHLELPGVPGVRSIAADLPCYRGFSVTVTFSRSSISSFYAARYAARGAHRASPARKYLLDRPCAEFLRVWRRGFPIRRERKRRKHVYAHVKLHTHITI